ncbi:Scr1 family TA system antitoxin-like transcriptional regulator [Gandjariella thermophila]|uniref:Scr1 family TA system antitoxin-like transcriptional regulator n=1 Tax=Gandjariella thermophila TaxID=1931992 RepID=UPI0027D939EF|nr:Scr1 family TA system antitoxin-like transcriptional regulator [Gandjariella thermophila]
MAGPFVLFEFPRASPVVCFEPHSSGAFVPTEHDVTEYRRAIEWLRRIAKTRKTPATSCPPSFENWR